MQPKLFIATKAFINYHNKILIIRESSGYQDGTNIGKYDVAGGRVKPGERFDKGLLREVKEETGLEVKISYPFFVNEWRPKVKEEQWQIVGIFFECFSESDKIMMRNDHDDCQWINPQDYKKYNLIENLYPAFQAYLSRKNG